MFKKNRTKIKRKHKFKEFVRKYLLGLIILILIFYLLFFVSGKLIYLILTKIDYFRLTEIYVKDHFTLEGDDAFEFAGLKRGENIFSIELSSLAKEIHQRHPEFEAVVARRIPPNRITIQLKERKPVMQIKLVKFYPIDDSGFVIPYPKEIPYPDLPIIIGIEPEEVIVNRFSNSSRIKKAIEIVNRLNEYPWRQKVTKINLTNLNDISFFLNNSIEIKLGSSLQKEKFDKLSQVLDEIKMKSLSPAFVDLRFKDVIIGPR